MKTIFFDTEFTGLVVDPALISIGLVDETGARTFYAELTDTWRLVDVGDFVREAVLPLLQGGEVLMTMAELQTRLRTWIEAFGEPVQLATDSLSWDWPWIHEIFHEDGTWPSNLDRRPVLVTPSEDLPRKAFNLAVEACYTDGLRRHHALDDARANRQGWLASRGSEHV